MNDKVGSGHKSPFEGKHTHTQKGLELLLSKNISSNTTPSGSRHNQLTYNRAKNQFLITAL